MGNPGRGCPLWRREGGVLLFPASAVPTSALIPSGPDHSFPPPSFLISIKSVTVPCCCHPGTGATLQNVLCNPREETPGEDPGEEAKPRWPHHHQRSPPAPVASAACRVRAKLLSASSHFTCPVSLGGSTATILLLPITKLGSKKVTALETRSVWL